MENLDASPAPHLDLLGRSLVSACWMSMWSACCEDPAWPLRGAWRKAPSRQGQSGLGHQEDQKEALCPQIFTDFRGPQTLEALVSAGHRL